MGTAILDRNISWEQSLMTDLKSNSNTILTQADAVSESLETIVGEVSSTYERIIQRG